MMEPSEMERKLNQALADIEALWRKMSALEQAHNALRTRVTNEVTAIVDKINDL